MQDDNIKKEIVSVLKKVKGEYFSCEESLITDGYISSFDLIRIVSELEKSFQIKIRLQDIIPDDFNSVSSMCEVIERYMK